LGGYREPIRIRKTVLTNRPQTASGKQREEKRAGRKLKNERGRR